MHFVGYRCLFLSALTYVENCEAMYLLRRRLSSFNTEPNNFFLQCSESSFASDFHLVVVLACRKYLYLEVWYVFIVVQIF